jgi:hypothetical protein
VEILSARWTPIWSLMAQHAKQGALVDIHPGTGLVGLAGPIVRRSVWAIFDKAKLVNGLPRQLRAPV